MASLHEVTNVCKLTVSDLLKEKPGSFEEGPGKKPKIYVDQVRPSFPQRDLCPFTEVAVH